MAVAVAGGVAVRDGGAAKNVRDVEFIVFGICGFDKGTVEAKVTREEAVDGLNGLTNQPGSRP